jgi:hypothetical protein
MKIKVLEMKKKYLYLEGSKKFKREDAILDLR